MQLNSINAKIKDLQDYIKVNRIDLLILCLTLTLITLIIKNTWASWGDAIIDCGRDLYIAEQMNKGKTLYTDLYYSYGPLVPYFFSYLFKFFPVNLNVGYFTGIIITYLMYILLFFFSKILLNKRSSIIIISIMYILLGFNPFVFNYIFPYSYSALFSSLFTLCFCIGLAINIKNNDFTSFLTCSICVGLSILTKIEFGVSLFIIWTGYNLFKFLYSKEIKRSKVIIYCVSVLLLPLTVFGLLIYTCGSNNLLNYIQELIITSNSKSSIFFMSSKALNISFLSKNLSAIYENIGFFIIIFLILYGTIHLINFFKFTHYKNFYIIIPVLTFYLYILAYHLSSHSVFTQLVAFEFNTIKMAPIFSLIIFIIFTYKILIKKELLNYKNKILLATSALVTLTASRFFLNLSPVGYGIYYFLPFLPIMMYSIDKLKSNNTNQPPWIEIFRYYLKTTIIIVLISFSALFLMKYESKQTPLKTEKGVIYSFKEHNSTLSKLNNYIKKYANKDQTVLLLPEETLLYFLTDKSSPTKYNEYLPLHESVPDFEQNLIKSIKKSKTNLIAISNRVTEEYGSSFWGIGYNKATYAWIKKNFKHCTTFNDYRTEKYSYEVRVYQKICPLNK